VTKRISSVERRPLLNYNFQETSEENETVSMIEDLQAELNVPGRRINRALEDRVRSAFFELTLREALT
jgi:hypothetical protein